MAIKAREGFLICPNCDAPTVSGKYDATFRDPDKPKSEERNLFGIPGALCVNCSQLYVDKDIIELLNLRSYRCTFAILSDRREQEAAS